MGLHITNGDCAGALIAGCGFGGNVLCWCDVLHDGPVPAALSHEALTDLRASFIAERGWANLEDVRAKFARRDEALRSAKTFGEVVLWFEHDLYDQLQLIQILDWFARSGVEWTKVWLVQAAEYLGETSPDRLRDLYDRRIEVTRAQYQCARDAWEAFRAPEPGGLESHLSGCGALPHLGPALRRFAEEYPWVEDGLTRTERTILHWCAREPGTGKNCFGNSRKARTRSSWAARRSTGGWTD